MKGRKPSAIIAGTITRVPPAPKRFSPEAKTEWRRILPDLVQRRTLTPADMPIVENLCILLGRVREIERLLQSSGFDPKLVIAQRNAVDSARQIAAEVGATPVSRSRPMLQRDGGDDLSYLD